MPRNLRLFYVFRLLATSYFYLPISFFFMQSRGLGFDEVMFLGAFYAGTVILFEVPTGALADRIGRRTSMMAGSLAMVCACIVAYYSHSFAMFAVSESLAALSMTLCSGADSAYLYDLLKSRGMASDYARREGVATAWHLFGTAAACLLGGWLAGQSLAIPYLVTACSAGVCFFVTLLMRSESWFLEPRKPQPLGAELAEYARLMGGAVRDVWKSSRLLWIIAYSALVFSLLMVTKIVYQPYLHERNFDFFQIGLAFAGLHLLAAFVATQVGRLRRTFGEASLVWALLFGLAVSFPLLNLLAGIPAVLALLAVQAAAKGMFSPLVKPILNRQITDSSRRATILSVESIARRAVVGLSHPAVGLFGLAAGLYLCGALGVIGLLVLAVMVRQAPLLRLRDSGAKTSVDIALGSVETAASCDPLDQEEDAPSGFTSSPSAVPRTESTAR